MSSESIVQKWNPKLVALFGSFLTRIMVRYPQTCSGCDLEAKFTLK